MITCKIYKKNKIVRTLNKILCLLILVINFLIISSCEKAVDYYLGVPMQPKFYDKSDWKNELNIFGVIRPDSDGKPMSFVYLVHTTPTKNDTFSDPVIKNASVFLFETTTSGIIDTIKLSYAETKSDTSWSFPRYVSDKLKPEGGTHYKIVCSSPCLPVLTGETTVPFVPEVVKGSLSVTSSKINFKIVPDTIAYLYDIYLFSANDMQNKRVIRNGTDTVKIDWIPEHSATWQILIIGAYDRNMAKYITTATNSFFNFNTYRPPVTTVNGGYGCFGSLNYKIIELAK